MWHVSPNFSGARIFLINRALLNFSIYYLSPSQANVLFLYPMETSQNLRFSHLFREYGNGTMAWYGLNNKGRSTKVLFTLFCCASKNIMKGTIEATFHRLKEAWRKLKPNSFCDNRALEKQCKPACSSWWRVRIDRCSREMIRDTPYK